MGYHKAIIPKGVIGEVSKIEEEFLEFKDAVEQNNKVMTLIELSDLIGAIDLYLDNKFSQEITVYDLLIMSEATQRAFESGDRK